MEVSFGERIKELRKLKKLSQEQISEMCDVSVSCVSRWENDNLSPNNHHKKLLARALGVKVNDLYIMPELLIPENVLLAEILAEVSDLSIPKQQYVLNMIRGLKTLYKS